jgi:hypothetical protein
MPFSVGSGGAWKLATGPKVGASSAWKNWTAAWVGVGGVWKRFYLSSPITISDHTVQALAVTVGDAQAVFQLTSAGDIVRTTDGTNVTADAGDWINPKVDMALYESRFDLLSGTLSAGTTGTWQALSSNRSWVKARVRMVDGVGTSSATGTLQIRLASSGTVVASVTIALHAQNS